MNIEIQTDEVTISSLKGIPIEHWLCTFFREDSGIYRPSIFFLKLKDREWSRYFIDAWILTWCEYPEMDELGCLWPCDKTVNIAKEFNLAGKPIDLINFEQIPVSEKQNISRLTISMINGPTIVLDDDENEICELRITHDSSTKTITEKSHLCFQLYLGNQSPLPDIKPNASDSSFSTTSLSDETELKVRNYLSSNFIKNTFSNKNCGCGFRHSTSEFSKFEYEVTDDDELQANHITLVDYIRKNVSSDTLEIYGCFDGNQAESPQSTENIKLDDILNADFSFKAGVLYIVKL